MNETNIDWKERAEHWKAVADAEAARCAAENGVEINKLRDEILRLRNVFARSLSAGEGTEP